MWFSKVCEGSLLYFLRKHFQPLWTTLLWFSQHLFSFIWCSSFANNIQSIWSSKFQLQLDWELAWNTLLWIRIGTCWKIVIFVGLPVSFQSFLIFYLPVITCNSCAGRHPTSLRVVPFLWQRCQCCATIDSGCPYLERLWLELRNFVCDVGQWCRRRHALGHGDEGGLPLKTFEVRLFCHNNSWVASTLHLQEAPNSYIIILSCQKLTRWRPLL